MKEIITQIVHETIQSGIGQMIIAFGSWIYALLLFFITIYYAFISLIRSKGR